MFNIVNALELALEIHRDQLDRYGRPYILHPIRVMMRLESEADKTAAILHDVIEDSNLTLEGLKSRGCPPEIVKTVDLLSRREEEDYFDYIDRAKQSDSAVRIKIADLEDNMDILRIPEVKPDDLERLDKYRRAWEILKKERSSD